MAVPERGLEELAGRCRLQGPELGERPGRKGLRITLRGPLLKLGCGGGVSAPAPTVAGHTGTDGKDRGARVWICQHLARKGASVCSTQALLPPCYCLASGHCVLSTCFL